MTPRKAFVIGNLLSAGFGALIITKLGSEFYHWYLTGDLWMISRRGLGRYVSYNQFPVEVISALCVYSLILALGILCLGAAIINPMYYWRRLMQKDQTASLPSDTPPG
jgi:hypothetical protein